MAHHIKTAISLEKSLFEELARLAQDMQISRSHLLAQALAEYLERLHNQRMLSQLNAAYDDGLDAADQASLRYARSQHRRIAGAES